MNCREAAQYMSPYLDSELGATKTYELSEHLRGCSACRERFEAERRVDASMRERLQRETMPPATWQRIRTDVRTPGWLRRLRSPVGQAVAAAVAIVMLGTTFYVTSNKRAPSGRSPAIVRAIAGATRRGVPFEAKPGAADDVAALLRSEVGVELVARTDDPDSFYHPIDLISAEKRTDGKGRAYIELRLNCCGEPVLVAFAQDNGNLPDVFKGLRVGDDVYENGMNAASWRVGKMVAVASSEHTLHAVRDRLRPIAT